MQGLYRSAARLAHRLPVLPVAAAEAVAGRRAAAGRWREWAAQCRTDGPLVWFHAASVGEAQAAAPIMQRLRAARDVQLMLTYSSPSMQRWPGRWPADRVDYVPLDEPEPLASVFNALEPRLLCFSRGDLWPELVTTARTRRIPVAVVGGVIRVHSRRHRWPGRVVLGEMHRVLAYVGVVSDADRDRWIRAGVPGERVVVNGDPRHDWILERDVDLAPARRLDAWRGRRPVLVAGSVESEDITPLAAGVARARATCPELRVLAVPHDPTSVEMLVAAMHGAGLESAVWRGPASAPPDATVLVMSGLGLLADLYLAGDIACVGGGFRKGRLHAVEEAAAFALPVVTGPWGRDHCGTVALPRHAAGEALAEIVQKWVKDPGARAHAGLAARRCLVPGAAAREARHLIELLGPENTAGAPVRKAPD